MSQHEPETGGGMADTLAVAAAARGTRMVEPDVFPVEAQLQRVEANVVDLESTISALTMRLQPVLHEAYPEPGDERLRDPVPSVPVVRTLAGYADHVELLTIRVRDLLNRLAL